MAAKSAVHERLCELFPVKETPAGRGGEGMGVRTRRGGKVGERAGDGGRGLQIETGVGPAQHQLIVQQLKIQARRQSPKALQSAADLISLEL